MRTSALRTSGLRTSAMPTIARPARRMLVLALALTASLATPLAAQSDEAAAAKAFTRAEDLVAKANYTAARALYREIAERWPKTAAGQLAALRAQGNAFLGRAPLLDNGPSANRVDIVVMGDGYMLDKLNAFDDIARTLPKNFARDPVLEEYLGYHNFWRASVVSREDGIDGFGRTYDTALGGRMLPNVHGQATVDRGAVQRILGEIPEAEGLAVVFVKAGQLGTGGGGVAVIGGREDDTVIHEWGHAFAGLADEYIDQVHRGRTADSINVAGSGDPKTVPWRHWLEAGAPGIGVYEGAAGMQRGAWKPTTGGCVMEHGRYFCAVCREAVVLAIHRRVDPIDGAKPEPGSTLRSKPAPTLTVDVLRPRTHGLDVRFWVLPKAQAPAERPEPQGARRDRAERGALPPIAGEPDWVVFNAGKQVQWKVPVRERKPGTYVVVCRVRDTTKVARDTLPWVLKDDAGVLESERRWTLLVE